MAKTRFKHKIPNAGSAPKTTDRKEKFKIKPSIEQTESKPGKQTDNILRLLGIKVIPLGSVGLKNNVTGSSTLVSIQMKKGNKKIFQNFLVDFGGFQGLGDQEDRIANSSLPFEKHGVKKQHLNGVILTHAHEDHFGKTPILFRQHEGHKSFNAPIITHFSAAELMRLSLKEKVVLMEKKVSNLAKEHKEINLQIASAHTKSLNTNKPKKLTKEITENEVYLNINTREINTELFINDDERIYDLIFSANFSKDEKFKIIKEIYNKKIEIAKQAILFEEKDINSFMNKLQLVSDSSLQNVGLGVNIALYRSGHMLGSSQIHMEINDEEGNNVSILFTGDLGRQEHFILPAPTVPSKKYNLVIPEITYGGEYHPDFDENIEILKNKIKEVIIRKGKILVPCFKKQRMQDVLCTMIKIVEEIKNEMREEIEENYFKLRNIRIKDALQQNVHVEIKKRIDDINIYEIQPDINEKVHIMATDELEKMGAGLKEITLTDNELNNFLEVQKLLDLNNKVNSTIQQMRANGQIDELVEKEFEVYLLNKAQTNLKRYIRKTYGKKSIDVNDNIENSETSKKKHVLTTQEYNELLEQKKQEILSNSYGTQKVKNAILDRILAEQSIKLKDQFKKEEIENFENEVKKRISRFLNSWNLKDNYEIVNNGNKFAKIYEIVDEIIAGEETQINIDNIANEKLKKYIEEKVNKTFRNQHVRTKPITIDEEKRIKNEIRNGINNNTVRIQNEKNAIIKTVTKEFFDKIYIETLQKEIENTKCKYFENVKAEIELLDIEDSYKQEIYNGIEFLFIQEIKNYINKALKELKKIGKKSNEKVTLELQFENLDTALNLSIKKIKERYIKQIEEKIKKKLIEKKKEELRETALQQKEQAANEEYENILESQKLKVIARLKLEYINKTQRKGIIEKVYKNKELVRRVIEEITKQTKKEMNDKIKHLPKVPIFAAGGELEAINEQFIEHFSNRDGVKMYKEMLTAQTIDKEGNIRRKPGFSIIDDLHKNKFIGKIDKETGKPKNKFPAILCASSGMISGGAITGYLKTVLSDPDSCLVRVGYMAAKTLGRKIFNAKEAGIKELYTKECGIIPLNAELTSAPCFSTHGDQKDIETHLEKLQLKEGGKIMFNHGDQERIHKAIELVRANEIIMAKQIEIGECLLDTPIQLFP